MKNNFIIIILYLFVNLFLQQNNACDIQLFKKKHEDLYQELKERKNVLTWKNKSIDCIPVDLFNEIPFMETLDLSHNKIRNIKKGTFDKLNILQSLYLNDNELNNIPNGLFNDLKILQTLKLNHNKLTELPQGLFDNLNLLQELDLSGNLLKNISTHLFDNLKVIQRLYVNNNNIVNVTVDFFTYIKADVCILFDKNVCIMGNTNKTYKHCEEKKNKKIKINEIMNSCNM